MPTLSWLTRDKDVKRADGVAYRLLERDAGLSVGDVDSGHMLIQGDNLEALKSLLPYYWGKLNVKAQILAAAHSSQRSLNLKV